MDIGSLLAAADSEVPKDEMAAAYDDDFENENENSRNETKPVTAKEILKSAAKLVDKEEQIEAKQLFRESAYEVKDILNQRRSFDDHEDEGRGVTGGDAMDILLAADKDVSKLHKEGNIEVVKSTEEIDPDEGLESDNEEDEEASYDKVVNESLLHACHQGKMNDVEKILRLSGVNIMFRDRHGWTPLHWAASKGHNEIIEMLINCRRNQRRKLKKFLNAQDTLAGWTPLHVSMIFEFLFSPPLCHSCSFVSLFSLPFPFFLFSVCGS
jgi:ankyrin repeat protein